MDQSDLSQRTQRPSSLQQEQLKNLLDRTRRPPQTEIVRHPSRPEVPLSPSQERLWFLDQLLPQSTAYHLPLLLRLTGKLKKQALELAIQEIVARHEALRTSFLLREGQIVQVIAPHLKLNLAVHNLSSLPEAQRERQFQAHLEEELSRPFDLKEVPLIRTLLFEFDEETHRLLFILHHIIADAWSLRIIIREFDSLYRAYAAGQESPLREPPLQLGDYVSWLQETANEQEMHLAYWQKQLLNAPPVLRLPVDYPRPPVQSSHGAWIQRPLSPSLLENLKKLAQETRVTPFMLFLAAYAVLLARYSGETDVMIGTPIAQRNRTGLENIIGFVANTLVIRADLSGNPSFRELLGRIREVSLEGFSHADAPFEKIVERLQPVRDTSYSPLFQVMFLFQNIVQAPIQTGDLRIEVEGIEDRGAQFDLTLAVSGNHWRFQYNTDLFERATVERMASHFEVLLQGITTTPEVRVAELPLLTTEERLQILVAWNAQQADASVPCSLRRELLAAEPPGSPLAQGIHYLFERQVELTPTAIAATFANQQLTYEELNRKSNQLAHALIARGVGPEDLVGLAMERSLELLVGFFGILKAGGAYVPLDPLYPPERLALIIKDSQISLLLTQSHVLPRLPLQNTEVICLDTQWESIAEEQTHNPPARSQADNAVYVIFTSGSTGQPRGIIVRHGALVNHALAMVEAIGLAPGERFLQFASISFDASAVQIFPTLISGATLVLHRTPTELSNHELWQFCKDQQVTVLDFPTAFWHQWIEDMAISNLPLQPPARVFMTGGEKPAKEKLRLWGRLTKQPAVFISSYGPTETTITATLFRITTDSQELENDLSIPLGHPIPDVSLYILNQALQPVPIGVVGEVYIGGTGLARGYLRHPALTAERFLPNPFSQESGDRLYKTGDLARYLPDGRLEFYGRSDNQVKIRGFRIEPGEVEALIRQHQMVKEAAVVVRPDQRGDLCLVAYVVPRELSQEENVTGEHHAAVTGVASTSLAELQSEFSASLRRFLKDQLPNYMLPSAFVVLDSFPLTPNRKIDFQALPPPDPQAASENNHTPPRNVVEELLLQIWVDVLGGVRAGVHNNFFELGGHSLLATQLISQVRRVFKVELPLHRLFEAPTVAEFAEVLIQSEKQPGQIMALARRRKQIDSMSSEEIRARLSAAKRAKG